MIDKSVDTMDITQGTVTDTSGVIDNIDKLNLTINSCNSIDDSLNSTKESDSNIKKNSDVTYVLNQPSITDFNPVDNNNDTTKKKIG